MSDKHYSFFGAVERSFDKAAKYTKWDKGFLNKSKNVTLFTRCVSR